MTIGKKLGALVGILLLLFLILGIVSYTQIKRISNSMTEVTDVKEPINAAAYEMELNLTRTGFGLLGYLHDHNQERLERIKRDEEDFKKVQDRYRKLAETEKGKELSAVVGKLYAEFRDMVDKLLEIEIEQTEKMETLLQYFEEADKILDERIQDLIKPGEPNAFKKLQSSLEMEINTNGIAKSLANYLRTHDPQYEERINKDEQGFKKVLAVYRKLNLSPEEEEWASRISRLFIYSVRFGKEIIELDKKKEKRLGEFVELRRKLDGVLDSEIRALTWSDLEYAKYISRRTVATAVVVILILVGVGVLVGFFSSTSITRSITRPVTKLQKAALEIGTGKLDAKIDIKSEDEVGDLAKSFGKMSEDLKHLMQKEKELTASALESAEKERAKSEELDRAYNELRNTQALLIQTEKLSALGELGAGVAHELNNPLTGVLSLIRSYMSEKDKNGEEFKDLQTMEIACVHMAKIIEDFTTFTRQSTEEFVELDCNEIIRTIMSFTARILQKKEIRIEEHYDEKLPLVMGNKNQLQQVVVNMVTNARDATDEGGTFSITTRAVEAGRRRFVEMEFADSGCGISKENIDKIFDPFFTTKRPGRGIGLGLSIVHTIVKAHDGEVLVDSEEGKGATFIVRLPAVDSEKARA